MNIQVLIATMNQNDYSLLKKMNIQTDAIVGNQCDKNEITEFQYAGHCIKWLSLKEKGVGLNRNNTLMRSSADVVMFADDDMVFVDNYEKIVQNAFLQIPDADIIIFDLKYHRNPRKPITKIKRINRFGWTRFGTARISVRLDSIRLNGIFFNLCFGGGAQYSSGEDSLFLADCIRAGLNVYSYPTVIAELIDRESTWFCGYNDKFFYDKGVFFSVLFPKSCKMLSLLHCIKHRKKYSEYGCHNAYQQMLRGIKEKSGV